MFNGELKTTRDVFEKKENRMAILNNRLELKGLGITTNQNTDTEES